jgi:protein-S-isoprenylcysteine O-methyltransferase Ste14
MSPILKRIIQLLILVLVQAVCLFASAGTLRWPAAWWYLGLYLALLGIGAAILLPARPEVVAERSRGAQGAKPWDKWITRLIGIPTLGVLIVAGLDQRFSWTTPLPIWVWLLGVAAFIAGYGLVLWAMASNPFFSQVVRIQSERGHVAMTGGPYHIVRHPGYLGMTTSMLGAVLLLGSAWGLIGFVLYLALILTRTALEDRTLRAELPGYSEFALQTKYRLIPGIW